MAVRRKSTRPLSNVRLIDELNMRMPTDATYDVGIAESEAEVMALQSLRYSVFNVEMKEGLSASHIEGLDVDAFDDQCHHLYVRHRDTGIMVGTYRMQTVDMAQSHNGFYSGTLFDFSAAPRQLIQRGVEIGRACIEFDHRSLKVLYLLWKGLGVYAAHLDKQYLFGCCSLTGQNEEEGLAVKNYLEKRSRMHPDFEISPLESHICCQNLVSDAISKPPRLMRAYLSLGALICSPPAIDRKFKTIDFLTVFDSRTLKRTDLAFYRIA